MHYLNIGLDSPVSIFAICQAHAQLESDYNKNGIVIERPSNARRNESTGCQLSRMKYSSPYQWVDICAESSDFDDADDENIRDIYLMNVLKWGLPIDHEMKAFIKARYVPEFCGQYPILFEA